MKNKREIASPQNRTETGPTENNRKRKPTPRQAALLKDLTKGMSVADAARKAGYSETVPRQSGHQALKQMAHSMPEVMERQGLTDDALIDKYLRPALSAKETEFAKFEGKITDSVDVIAWSPRLTALDLAFRLKGSNAPTKAEADVNVDDVRVSIVRIGLDDLSQH
jgi:hypothetical protein